MYVYAKCDSMADTAYDSFECKQRNYILVEITVYMRVRRLFQFAGGGGGSEA